jgi:hypothetical protein
MKILGYILLAIAIGISLVFVYKLGPVSLGAWMVFAAVVSAPYLVLGICVALARDEPATQLANLLLIIVTTLAGLFLLTDIVFLHPDAQGAIAVVTMPILQLIGIGLLLWPLRWWLRRRLG